ncbi:MAG: GNAT family N-acetyltransferase [Alphaproteobacteria bacterium]|nr:GNAT family N-acetyltransferase [Alphaproteobacteria bacterium]
MNRAIKFKLKNGKVVVIRRTRGTDYEDIMKFLEKFTRGSGAIQTFQYAGQPKKDKEQSIKLYEDPNNLFISVWDGKNVVGTCSITKKRPKHPYCMGTTADIGMTVLDKYTHNGIGSKFFDICEKWARANGVHKMQAGVRHNNIPSIANCIKHGFIITGIEYDEVFINGKWLHHYMVEKILEN